MKIYTKQGDKGTTSVYAKTVLKVDKDDAIIECYGTLDELNSHLGLIVSLLRAPNKTVNIDKQLEKAALELEHSQVQLFSIGFALSDEDKLSDDCINDLENGIDTMSAQLPAQTTFILPGGSALSAHIHVARTVARRAERLLVSVSKSHDTNPLALAYVNRLSDYLFVLARLCNHLMGIEDIKV